MIVQAGKQFTAADLKATAGNLAALIHGVTQDGMDLGSQLATWTDSDLITLGLTQEEINAVKGFYIGDLPGIVDKIKASTWIRQLLGLGV